MTEDTQALDALTLRPPSFWLWNGFFSFVLIATILFAAFCGEIDITSRNVDVWRHAITATMDAASQFLWTFNLVAYIAFFAHSNLIRFSPRSARLSILWHPEPGDTIWLATVLAASLAIFISVRYCLDYKSAAANTDTVVLLAGVLLFQCVIWWCARGTHVSKLRRLMLNMFVLLGCGSFLISPFGKPSEFFYHGHLRWIGIYTNPNEFGAIMATIFLISLLRLMDQAKQRQFLGVVLFMAPITLSGICLANSYSREAWAITLFGCLVYFWNARKRDFAIISAEVGSVSFKKGPFRKSVYWLLGAGIVIGIGVSYEIPYLVASKTIFVQRAFSPFNQADFSSRNRLASFQDGISMLIDRPFSGYGWKDLIDLHNSLYLQPGLSDGQALKLNDFLMLALRFGIPTLAIFLLIIWACVSGRVKSSRGAYFDDNRLCKTMALMLAVGFNFTDGLFRLGTGGLLWLFLALSLDVESAISQRKSQLPIASLKSDDL